MRKTITTSEELLSELPTWYGRDFSFDTETSGLDYTKDRMIGLALYFSDGRGYYVVLEHTVELWDGTTQHGHYITDVAQHVRGLFAQRDVVMAAHNAKFDMHFLERLGVLVEGRLFDTLLAAQILDENRDNGLKSLAPLVGIDYAKYQTLHTYRGFGKEEILGTPLPDTAEYAMNDVEATWKLYLKFRNEIAEENMQEVFNHIWMPLLVTLQRMESRGIALDIESVKSVRDEYVKTAMTHERRVEQRGLEMAINKWKPTEIPPLYLRMATPEELEDAYQTDDGHLIYEYEGLRLPIITHDMIGKNKSYRPRIVTFNTGSRHQIQELVFEHTKVDLPDHVRLKRNPSDQTFKVDRDNLETIIFYGGDESGVLRDVLEWRKAAKFIGTYLDTFIERGDPNDHNAIHTSFNQAVGERGKGGTATGRLSSSGPNLQNIPSRGAVGKQARSMFVARPNHSLIVADYSQMELRMLAHYSQDEALLTAFEEDRDLHLVTGAAFAQTTYEDLFEKYHADDPWAKDMRMLGKTGNFALTYGMGATKFQRYLLVNNKYEITVDQAAQWIKDYNVMFAGATTWKERVWRFVRKHGYIRTIGGRKRRLPEASSPDTFIRMRAERQGVNAVIQGSCGDIICESMPPIQAALSGIGGSILLQVHDEIVAEVPDDYAEMAVDIIETYMVGFVNPKLSCPMKAEAHIGKNWGEAKG